jgi:hypothetical protein
MAARAGIVGLTSEATAIEIAIGTVIAALAVLLVVSETSTATITTTIVMPTRLDSGGSGPDRLAGDAGVDIHRAGSGNDNVSSADGTREAVDCGSGRDRARVDRKDRVKGCERVKRIG